MTKDVFTLLGLGALGVVVVLGYQNFDRQTSQVANMSGAPCRYTKEFVSLDQVQHQTPIVYSLENQKIWKGQSGAGPFMLVSPEADLVQNFKVISNSELQALSKSKTFEYALLQTLNGGTLWSLVASFSEEELGGIIFDAIEYQNEVVVVLKKANQVLQVLKRRPTGTHWEVIKEYEAGVHTVAALGKDAHGDLVIGYTYESKIIIEKMNGDSSHLQKFSEFQFLVPWAVSDSSYIGIAVDRNDVIRSFVSLTNGQTQETGSAVVSFSDDGKRVELTEFNQPGMIITHISVSEDGTVSLDGIKKASEKSEAFLKVNICN